MIRKTLSKLNSAGNANHSFTEKSDHDRKSKSPSFFSTAMGSQRSVDRFASKDFFLHAWRWDGCGGSKTSRRWERCPTHPPLKIKTDGNEITWFATPTKTCSTQKLGFQLSTSGIWKTSLFQKFVYLFFASRQDVTLSHKRGTDTQGKTA